MTTEYPYLVVWEKNGEIGWSGTYTLVDDFRTYEEAKELFDKIEVEEHNYDFSTRWKRLYKVEVLERG